MVVARHADETVKIMLADRFQIAIDEAAMRLGSIDSGSYLDGWHTSEWTESNGSPSDVAAEVSRTLETEFDQESLDKLLESLETAE